MNNIFRIIRDYKWESAHRVEGHPKCSKLHGHSYVAQVCISSPHLDGMGFVLDFGDVDGYIKPYIEAMDHHYLVSTSNSNNSDPYEQAALKHRPQDLFIMELETTTAEAIAEWIGLKFFNELPSPLRIEWVEVQETARNRARWTNHGV